LLVLCPARSATAYLVAFSGSPSLPLRNASIYLVIEYECFCAWVQNPSQLKYSIYSFVNTKITTATEEDRRTYWNRNFDLVSHVSRYIFKPEH
jgi:hypothetical protein